MTPQRMPRMLAWRRVLRQRCRPAAFRVGAPLWDRAQRDQLERLLTQTARSAPRHENGEAVDRTSDLDEDALAAAATSLWRARRRLEGGSVETREARQLARLLIAAQDALARAGVKTQEYDGMPYDEGFSLNVIAFVPDASVTVDTVKETRLPSVYVGDRRVEGAHVIVGRPVGDEEEGE